ncbi:MAG TPA: hypothetical protein IAA60_04700 [Candidatus Ornithomonoglobus intestinigallinarum]|uniref:Uncharacterized protein n=1 Tax=Candidatus Ornithomonoglobus intestinigallinarum TaxID=2840894 RepID=A0A9D1H243_9FIRM|nr:hypothetical protein [Candidatus Ornithomonoglobus intestinigallinarum]
MNIKKTAAVFAAAAALAAFSAVSYAEGNVAEVNGVGYDTLQKAVDAAGNGDTVKLIADLTGDGKLTGAVTIAAEDNITLDLGNHTIEIDPLNEERAFNVNGTMTVTGNGRITSTAMGAFDVKTGGSLTIESGTYEGEGYRRGDSGGGATLRTRPGSTIKVCDGVVVNNEKCGALYSEGKTILGACELTSKSHNGLTADDGGSLYSYCTQIMDEGELNGTIVRGVQGGLYVGGEATINGGSYTAAELTDSSYSGNKAFYGLYISNGAKVTINDGTFMGGGASGGYCVLNSDNDTGMKLGSIIINDGIFNGKVGSLDSDKVRDAYGITAYGGKFTEDPMYFVDSSCVSMQVNDEGKYVVIPVNNKATETGTYKTAVGDNDTYDQMSLFEVSAVPNSVTYTVSDGTNNEDFIYNYASVEGITKLGLIVTDIPSAQTVTVELGGQNNE